MSFITCGETLSFRLFRTHPQYFTSEWIILAVIFAYLNRDSRLDFTVYPTHQQTMEVQTFVSTVNFDVSNKDDSSIDNKENEVPEKKMKKQDVHTIGEHRLTKKQLNEFRKAFGILDRNGNGCVTKEELGRVMKALGQFARKEELNRMIQEVGLSDDSNIDFNTFVDVSWSAGIGTEERILTRQEEEELKEAFRVFDRNGRGFITATDLKKFMRRLGEDLPEDEIDAMIKEADIDRDGRIDFYEFVDALDEPGTEENSSDDEE